MRSMSTCEPLWTRVASSTAGTTREATRPMASEEGMRRQVCTLPLPESQPHMMALTLLPPYDPRLSRLAAWPHIEEKPMT